MVVKCPICEKGVTDYEVCQRCGGKGYLLNHWRTRDGTILSIPDMDNKHILNCIRMLERNVGNFRLYYEMSYVINLPRPRTDHVQDAIDSELDYMVRMDNQTWLEQYHETYKELVKEARDRGILNE